MCLCIYLDLQDLLENSLLRTEDSSLLHQCLEIKSFLTVPQASETCILTLKEASSYSEPRAFQTALPLSAPCPLKTLVPSCPVELSVMVKPHLSGPYSLKAMSHTEHL